MIHDPHLIDTSMWTCALRRRGDAELRERVLTLIRAGKAAWCDAVRLELWRGAGSDSDREQLRELEANIPTLPIDERTWSSACRLANHGRMKGMQFPPLDLVIFACAKQHRAKLVARDHHFETLEALYKHPQA